MKRETTWRIFLKHPTETGWSHVGDEWATSRVSAVRKFRAAEGRSVRQGDKLTARKLGDPTYNPSRANPKREWYVSNENRHIGSVYASSKAAALRQAQQKWGRDKYIIVDAYSTGSKTNPRRVKGAKVAGGRAVSLRNFTGRVIRKRDGTVQILGRTRR
jgi:hypothetical protein